MFYITLMVVTLSKKPVRDIQKTEESKHTTRENHQITEDENKRRKEQGNYKIARK